MKLEPILPFEPISTDTIPSGDNWVAQIKWDGVRMLTYFDGNEVRLVNRKLNDRTVQYPEFLDLSRYCHATSVILDCL
ncbi:ATP-dependent DNA ligase [Brevibacillus nitrificans]|nr:ATP-dependent DNA ligase [Brevibacillus nitrificans]